MGLRINTNVLALNAQHKLMQTTKKLATSLERLSSGLRINSGKDDAVGLAKSESLRTQIRGISASELNLANGQSLLGIAEGSLAQLTDITQRLREQVIQAADSTISSTDRDNLTTNINDMLTEYTRLANASEFDGVKLLNGSFVAKSMQVGPNAIDQISITINDARSTSIGKVAVITAETLSVRDLSATVTTDFVFADTAGPVTINSVDISAATALTSDGVSAYEADESAIAWVNLINQTSGQTGVSAVVNGNYQTLTYTSTAALISTDKVYINGVAIAQAAYSADDTGAAALVTAINNISTQTGVTATIAASSDTIVLGASDGRNIAVLYSSDSVTGASVSDLFGLTAAAQNSDMGVMWRSTFKLYSDDTFTVANADAEFASSDSVTASLISTTSLSNLNVSTTSNAIEGIFILDNAIRQIQAQRANVGSKALRFEVAETELQVRKENLTSSESRIRDADIAVETAALTSAQILQQAGASVLQRANSAPQIALTLLQQ